MGRGQSRGGGRGGARGFVRGRGGRGRGRGRGDSRATRAGGKVDGKLDRWKKAEDVPMDEEDEFFAARDKILLDDTARARARAGPAFDDGDEFDQDDEVFGLDGVGESSEDEGSEDEEGDDEEQDEVPVSTKSKATAKQAAHDDDDDVSSDSEEELSRWGKSRSAYYADNSRVMDEDDTEAREMEEREGRRLQAKLISEIGEDDWGFNDVHDTNVADSLSAVPANLPLPTDKASLLRHMEKHDPLTLALAHDWEDTAYQVMETSTTVKEIETSDPNDPSLGLMHLHHQTLLSYAATLAFYLHLQAIPTTPETLDPVISPTPLPLGESKRLRSEVIARLLTLKQSLATLEDLGFAADGMDGEDLDGDDFSDDESDISVDGGVSFHIDGSEESEGSGDDVSPYGLKLGEQVSHANGGTPRLQNLEEDWQQDKLAGWMESSASSKIERSKGMEPSPALDDLDDGELEALMKDALELAEPASSSPQKRNRKSNTVEPVEKVAKKKKKATATEAPVFDLVEPEFTPTTLKDRKRGPTGADVNTEEFGDPTQLSHTDASDKAGRRRTLRFHTSKIESSSNRRSAARAGMGGDDDLPYRDRRKEQKRKGLGEGGDDLDMDVDAEGDAGADADTPSVGKRLRDSVSPVGDEEDEDGYYDLVRKAKKQRKDEKQAEYDSTRAAERIDPDEDSSSGPRSLTRAILKNRGMTPNRSPKNKAARNPRVKKKLQYAKAQKKLGSRQAVFKGGSEVAAAREGRYEGEKSGISGRVVKSVKL